MALFSRGKRTPDDTPGDAAAAPEESARDGGAEEHTEEVPHVGISVSTFGRPATTTPAAPDAAAAPAPPSADAPPAGQPVPDNVILRAAISELPAQPTGPDIMGVARQLLQGHMFLRVKGDARAILAAGGQLPLAMVVAGDKQFTVAYSSLDALRASIAADGDTDTSALAQPVASVLRYVLQGTYAGLILDPSTAPARIVLPRELLQRMLDEMGGREFVLKRLVSSERTARTPDEIARALVGEPFWVSVAQTEQGPGISEARTTDGRRLLEIFSHPLEVIATGRGTQPAPMTASQLAAALVAEPGLDGVVLDPSGPWIALSRAQLGPVLALAPDAG